MNLESYQKQINRKFDVQYNIPIVYFSQLIWSGLGLSSTDLGLQRMMIPLKQPKKVGEGTYIMTTNGTNGNSGNGIPRIGVYVCHCGTNIAKTV